MPLRARRYEAEADLIIATLARHRVELVRDVKAVLAYVSGTEPAPDQIYGDEPKLREIRVRATRRTRLLLDTRVLPCHNPSLRPQRPPSVVTLTCPPTCAPWRLEPP